MLTRNITSLLFEVSPTIQGWASDQELAFVQINVGCCANESGEKWTITSLCIVLCLLSLLQYVPKIILCATVKLISAKPRA